MTKYIKFLDNPYKNISKHFYNNNALDYIDKTLNLNESHLYQYLINELPNNNKKLKILDLGSGSGRDTIHFINNGFNVTAVDGAEELAKLSTLKIRELTSIKDFNVKVDLFENLNFSNEAFDIVWSNASLDHTRKSKIIKLLEKFIYCIKRDGFFYISLRNGEGEKIDTENKFVSYYDTSEIDKLAKNLSNKLSLVKKRLQMYDSRKRKNFGWHQLVFKKI